MNTASAPFNLATTAAETVAGLDLSGRRVTVTGGGAGIGLETVRALAGAGAAVTLAVRAPERMAPVVEQLRSATENPAIDACRLDLADRSSIRTFVQNWSVPLHLLFNNAGVMALPRLERTPQGWEMQFATNYLGHFELTLGLHRYLADAGGARIVSLSSSGHLFAPVFFDDLHFNFIPYDPLLAYGQSKSATALFAVAATEHWRGDGIFSNAVMPGAIATGLQKHTGGLRTPPERQKTAEQGAATTTYVGTSPTLIAIGGRYYEDLAQAEVVDHRGPEYKGVARYAVDPANADRLWDTSIKLLA